MITQVKTSVTTAEPIMLSISPDWPSIIVTGAIGLGSVLTSIGVVYVSKANQKTQNKAKSAELRHAWTEELRESLSNFDSIATVLHFKVVTQPDFPQSDEFTRLIGELSLHHKKILLMLDENKEITIMLTHVLRDVMKSVVKRDSSDIFNQFMDIKQSLGRQILENAWLDIKNELIN
ncbi:hypothetical protein [Vibrio vulnificus]|uniref:hypothetical protein n=1 Tax=Vibrio vulnificus TaxID=672 RepID=UPI0015954DDD|nr:hypothetical protein [Vibrio vulnificus]